MALNTIAGVSSGTTRSALASPKIAPLTNEKHQVNNLFNVRYLAAERTKNGKSKRH